MGSQAGHLDPGPGLKNRIIGYKEVDPASLLANPLNARLHPRNQQEAMLASLGELGWLTPILVDQHDTVIDGHMRVLLALREQEPVVPVLVLNLSPEEVTLALASFDPIGALAVYDGRLFEELRQALPATPEAFDPMLERLSRKFPAPRGGGESALGGLAGLSPGSAELPPPGGLPPDPVPDEVFPSSNEWGVPDLLFLPEHSRPPARPFTRWGSQTRRAAMPGTWHFYTEDYKFSALWKDPQALVETGARLAVEPNFSTAADTPRAVVLWGIYRKRWLARYWQQHGVEIIVDLNIHPAHRDLALLGVPDCYGGWYATRGSADLALLEADYAQARARRGSVHTNFLVYGGPKSLEPYCRERGWLWLPEDAQVKAGRW